MAISEKRVLIYRLGSLGDTLIALPALHLVARAFPNADRRLLTNFPVNVKAPPAAAILEGSGLVNGYLRYAAGTRSPRELVALWWQLVRWRPEVLIYMGPARGVESAKRDARFFHLCGIKRIIGAPITEDMQQYRWSESEQVLEPEGARLARNLAELGDARLDAAESWDLHLTAAERARAKEVLTAAAHQPVIAASVGTKMQSKDWGRDNWRTLLSRLATLYPGYTLALCGALEESEASEFAADGWREHSSAPVINLCGLLTPRESAAVFARSRIFIGHDSGPMHLAAAVQTICVAIFSARNKPRTWFPYGKQHRVIYHQTDCWGCGLETCIIERKKCLTSVTVEEVITEVRAILH
ncbi:glycosyltransferase family 9 protein [Granulicella sp. L60]|uniref:glycosyltransferase family 9 protein n=1 Tax=Granulicella sp. L60 TaxID=1641866 RepID=UPI00131CF85A|nr:glycosyltransferase family 9 protein [Granulicella sp. L60]